MCTLETYTSNSLYTTFFSVAYFCGTWNLQLIMYCWHIFWHPHIFLFFVTIIYSNVSCVVSWLRANSSGMLYYVYKTVLFVWPFKVGLIIWAPDIILWFLWEFWRPFNILLKQRKNNSKICAGTASKSLGPSNRAIHNLFKRFSYTMPPFYLWRSSPRDWCSHRTPNPLI